MCLIIRDVDVTAKFVNLMREKGEIKRAVDALKNKLDQLPKDKEVIMKKVCVLQFARWKVFFLQVVVLLN